MVLEILSFMEKKCGHCELDHQHEGGKTCKESQHQQQAAKDFCKKHQDERPSVSYVEWIEEDGLLVAEILQLGKSVVDADDQAESQAQQEAGKVECIFGIGGGEKFLHDVEFFGWVEDSRFFFVWLPDLMVRD